jgi:hypothetical protein
VCRKALEALKYPFSAVVMIAFDGSVASIPFFWRKASTVAIGGSLDFMGNVHKYREATSMMVRNPM